MTTTPNRRWYQFSVKSLLLVLTLLSTGLGYLVIRVERQRAAVERVKQLGGRVQYSSQPSTEREMLRKAPWHVRQLRKYLPVDYVDEVQAVDLSFTGATDADLRHLTDLAQLERLDLTGTKVTDAGLVHIPKLSKLTDLFLAHTEVTDAGVTPLKRMKQLEFLYLVGDDNVSWSGVGKLQLAMPNCDVVK